MFRNKSNGKTSLRRTSVNHKRCFGFVSDISTKLTPKEAREFEYGLLDSTCYEEERKEYFKGIAGIRSLRVIEFIGKFKPVEEKIAKLDELDRQFTQLQATLDRLLKCCQAYQKLAKSETPSVRRASSVDEEPFALKIKKDLKEIETSWAHTFVEGNLKKLHDLLAIIGLEEHEVNLSYAIQSWVISAETCFVPSEKKLGCCLRLGNCFS